MNEATKILFNDAVEHLRLPIALGMISHAHAQLGPAEFGKLPPELAEEEGVTVGD